MVVREVRKPIINIPPHLAWHLEGILQTEGFCLNEHWQRVRQYYVIPGHDKPHTMHAAMKAQQEWVRP